MPQAENHLQRNCVISIHMGYANINNCLQKTFSKGLKSLYTNYLLSTKQFWDIGGEAVWLYDLFVHWKGPCYSWALIERPNGIKQC